MPQPEIRNCIGCGRDTTAQDGLCLMCRVENGDFRTEEMLGRKVMPSYFAEEMDFLEELEKEASGEGV